MTRTRLVLALVVVVGLAAVGVAWWAREGVTVDRGTSTLAGPVKGVDVQIDAGRVDVEAGPGVNATVERTRHYLRGAPALTQTFENGVVRVLARCSGPVVFTCSTDIRVQAPAATPVRVRTTRGAVVVNGMTNGVDVGTSSGAVHLGGVSGPVVAATSAGSITGVDLAPSALDAVTSGGAIRVTLGRPPGRVGLRTGSGRIDLALPPADGGYRVSTHTGGSKPSVTVAQDPSSARAVSASTGAGRISVHPR